MSDNIKIEEIDRRSGLTRRAFVDEYQRPNKPVIFTDLTKDWIAREKYTLDYFRSEHGDRVAHIEGKPYKLADYIDLLKKATVENPAPYPCKLDLREDFKDLVKDGLSQDDGKRAEKDIQDLTDKFVGTIDEIATAKEKEVLEV